jgi:hypothetical protein
MEKINYRPGFYWEPGNDRDIGVRSDFVRKFADELELALEKENERIGADFQKTAQDIEFLSVKNCYTDIVLRDGKLAIRICPEQSYDEEKDFFHDFSFAEVNYGGENADFVERAVEHDAIIAAKLREMADEIEARNQTPAA